MIPVRLKLRELAERKGFNMSRLQRRSGLTMGMIRRYWLNETGEVKLDALGMLAQLLEVKPGDLLTDEPEQAENGPEKNTAIKKSKGKKVTKR